MNLFPSALFKYKDVSGKGIERVEDMLRNNSIWYSSPLQLNDPFECGAKWEIGNSRQDIVHRRGKILVQTGLSLADAEAQAEQEIPQGAEELEEWERQHIKSRCHQAENTGILCLTTQCDNRRMWTHYAGGHTGVCIVFRVRDVKDDAHIAFISKALPVQYVDDCPTINVVRNAPEEILLRSFLTKNTEYRYEEEFRILKPDKGRSLQPLPACIIGGMILGARIDPDHKERVIQACADYDGDVEIIQAELDPDTYGLRFELEGTAR